MADKRYQVFVSSTYADLKDERQKVIQAVIEMDCIPAGMELFPAADEEQFQFIKHVINDCDYYLLIIAGRYGSTTAEGISYTEKEYDYAVSIGLKVIALIHENPDQIPMGKSEKDTLGREKLEEFRKKVASGRLMKYWKSANELPGLVTMSLVHAIKMFPAVGWVRANKAVSVELLSEVNDLRKKIAEFEAEAGEFKPRIENLAGLEDKVTLHGTYRNKYYGGRHEWHVTCTWRAIFVAISPYMMGFANDGVVKSVLTDYAFNLSSSRADGENPDLDDQLFRTIAVQLTALGLVKIDYSQTMAGGMALFWSNTRLGKREMMEFRTVKGAQDEKSPG